MTDNRTRPSLTELPSDRIDAVFIDAGTGSLHVAAGSAGHDILQRWKLPIRADIQSVLHRIGLNRIERSVPLYITGKLRDVVQTRLGRGKTFIPAAALWTAAESLADGGSLAILEISATGFAAVGVHAGGELKDGLLTANARCGAGSGINIDRVLQKLALSHAAVDRLLKPYLGPSHADARRQIPVRVDRCGVFASSATVSDKNQGIPIDYALAVTLKSEVVKACRKLTTAFDTVWLTGGVFAWQYTRDCARDVLQDLGAGRILYDAQGDLPLRGLMQFARTIGRQGRAEMDQRPLSRHPLPELPPFQDLQTSLARDMRYHRCGDRPVGAGGTDRLGTEAVFIGLDVGSTMAKMVIASGAGGEMRFKGAVSNAGDTIETVKSLFREVRRGGVQRLNVRKIGITGSARYQVQKALANIYPQLQDRIDVLVENYAHARGAIDYVHQHIARLRAAGVATVNTDRCILVDVGGEDTKISTIDLQRGELVDNAMNIKCSAGTGSLLDVLAAMFDIPDIADAARMAFTAPGAFAINATCAVFLMENAIRLQAQGVPRDRIMASAVWAIVENMAHSLWNQLHLPRHAVVLLHGQTMQGAALALATASRLQGHLDAPCYCLVPPDPGHRACIGLINSMDTGAGASAVAIEPDAFIGHRFRKRIVQCRGIACGDPGARCNRSHLISVDGQAARFSFTLGGCTAVNDMQGSGGRAAGEVPDTYRQIWSAMDAKLPRSDDANRLVIPRSFAVSEWSVFFSHLFTPMGIPVHVDNVDARDISRAQAYIHIDTCAPHMGAVGQMMRLAEAPHGVILAPQIEFLPVRGNSLGRTCTINQGGMAVARSLAAIRSPQSRIVLFHISLKGMTPDEIAHQIYPRLAPVYAHYGRQPAFDRFRRWVDAAWQAQIRFRTDAADTAAGLMEAALADGRHPALVVGREYVLHPGIFDSHVGRLLRDKGLAGLPGHLLDVDLNPDFDHLYWKNAHLIATLADASAQRRLHHIVRHPGLKRFFQRVEKASGADIALIQVSTFLCGPDSVTNPLINELVKQRPFLRIQSDAVVQELAHLENRMNTYVKQLAQGLHQSSPGAQRQGFDITVLEDFSNRAALDPRKDAIYLPTLADNRTVTSVIRGAGFTCIDNYRDDYDLTVAVKTGRAVAGDGVCTPLAAVYGDILMAIEDFQRRKLAGDPSVEGRTRLLIFNNKGLGPCRQGQYVETHKLFLHKKNRPVQSSPEGAAPDDFPLQFLVGHENRGFNTGFPQWAYLRCIQGIILQGVLHQLLADGAARCGGFAEYKRFTRAYADLKARIFAIQEHGLRPSDRALDWARRIGGHPIWGWPVKYMAYRFYDRRLTRELRRFAHRWNRPREDRDLIRIHLDGEVYMRIAQFETILQLLVETLGFRRFRLTHTPVWGFLEYKLAGSIMRAREGIAEGRQAIQRAHSAAYRDARLRFVRQKKRQMASLFSAYAMQRFILARPLYRAAGIDLPEAVPTILDLAQAIVPTRRPGGELLPYTGEATLQLRQGIDLLLNVAPEGCMVSSMGEMLTPAILQAAESGRGMIEPLFSQQGDVDAEKLTMALLKSIGPHRLYGLEEGD